MATECLDRDIEITPIRSRVTLYHKNTKLASSGEALALREVDYPVRYYLPRHDVPEDLLVTSDHRTHCPFKGDAVYYHLRAGGTVLENAAWCYADPCPLVEPIRGYLSFWGEHVRVVTED